MKNFFKQILNKINKIDDFTSNYKRYSTRIEIPAFAYTNWAMHFASIKDFDTAIEKLKTAILMSGQNAKPCISLGVIYAKLKEYKQAEEILKEAINRDSTNAYTYSVLSSVLVAEDRFEEAEGYLKRAIKISPSDAEIYFNYGILYAKQKKNLKAIDMFKKAKSFDPTNPHFYFLTGTLFLELDKTAEAFLEFKHLEKIDPTYKNLYYNLAICYKREKNHMAVLEYGQRALELDTLNPAIYILLARNYLELNQNENCLKTFQQSENKGIKDFELYLAWGITLYNLNNIREAKTKFEKALKENPNNTDALYRLGSCFYQEKNFQEAKELFIKAIKESPTNSLAIANLGLLFYDEKDWEEAIKYLFNAIAIDKTKTYLYFYIANSYYKIGKIRKSIDYYQRTLEYHPKHIEALINYTICLLDTDNLKDAMREIRSAYQLNRDSLKILLIYALTSFKCGLYSESIDKTKMILEQEPKNIDAQLILIYSLINQNKGDEALQIIQTLSNEVKEKDFILFLTYKAYKILVENEPSNYNEEKLKLYQEKINDLNDTDFSISQINAYLSNTLNINKG